MAAGILSRWMSARVSVPPISIVDLEGERARSEGERAEQSSMRAVLLSGTHPIPEGTAERWLIQLRWLAIVGMVATTAMGKALVPALHIAPVVSILGALAVVNGVFSLVVGKVLRARGRVVGAQIAFDVLALGAVLWVSGGVSNPFAAFLVFQIALAGLLCRGRTTLGIAALTALVALLVAFADPLPLAAAPIGEALVRKLSAFVSIASASAFLGLCMFVYARRLEDLRQRTARHEKLAMLGRVVGGMSHELSTPLATILLAGEELAAITREGQPEAATLARTIAGEAQRASDIIGLVRGYIRPDQRREEIEVGAFVSDFAAKHLGRLGYRGEFSIEAPDPVVVSVLTSGLGQVLGNVLTNATEAMGGVEAQRIAIEVRARGDHAEIVVEDSGPGFSPEILARLGEPFQTTKERQGGMGLGLYVSSVLLERMSGTLSVGNGPGGGARVSIRLGRCLSARDSEV